MKLQELTMALYAWDLADEGVEHVLDVLQERVGINAIYMVALMHYERKPWTPRERSMITYFQHNPVRKEYFPEDARIYWLPDPNCYKDSPTMPLTTERDFLKGKDWLNVMCEAAHRRGIRSGVDIAHTIFDAERARGEFSHLMQCNVYGEPFTDSLWKQIPCHYHPNVRAYARAIARDVAANHDLDMVMPALFFYHPGRPDLDPLLGIALGGCFCPACERAARDEGLDWEWMKADVRSIADMLSRRTIEAAAEWVQTQKALVNPGRLILEHPGFYEWLRFRCRGAAGLYREMCQGAKEGNPDVDFRFNTCWPRGETIGQDLRAFAEFCDSFRVMEYSETSGDLEFLNKRKPGWLMNVRREIGTGKPLMSAIGTMPMATPELIKQGIRIAAACGVEGLSLAFYDGATNEYLDAVREGMQEAELTVDAPAPPRP
jgi:hypothetical protein